MTWGHDMAVRSNVVVQFAMVECDGMACDVK